MDTPNKIRHLSLCSGYDGLGLGLIQAGLDIGFTVHVEVEAFPAFNLAKKMQSGALGAGVHYPDLKTFPFGKFRGCFDILSGGFPCQPFSQAGSKGADEDPRHLFPHILEGIRECRPPVVFLENVDGIVSAKLKGDTCSDPTGTSVLLHVLRELERVGYRATAIPSSASEVGAPHQRNRWFILGVAVGADERCRRGADSDGNDGGWVSIDADHFQAMVRGEVAGCSGDLRGDMADSLDEGLQGRVPSARGTGAERENQPRYTGRSCPVRGVWPSRPKQPQHYWEPPRVVPAPAKVAKSRSENGLGVGDTSGLQIRHRPDDSAIEPPLGGDLDGSSGGMGYAELCVTVDNHTDELRLLGNGVCPASARDAFLRGMLELGYTQRDGLSPAKES